MRVLIGEDDPWTVRTITGVLKTHGCEVGLERTAQGCLERAERESFDLVFLDLSLPDVPIAKSDKVIQLLKRANPKTKIVAMATDTTRELERCVRRQGILFYMTKPVARELLQRLLDHLMSSDRTGSVPVCGS
jgi:DNA-binding response OmpR family regulator